MGRVVGCGTDIIEVERIARAAAKPRFVERVFSSREQTALARRGAQSWAARFAGKEAVMKAMGVGWSQGAAFSDIEILNEANGRPVVRLKGRAQELARERGIGVFHLSLSHARAYAVAMVVAVEGTEDGR